MPLLRRNLDIVHLYGCVITETFTDRLIKFAKGHFALYMDTGFGTRVNVERDKKLE